MAITLSQLVSWQVKKLLKKGIQQSYPYYGKDLKHVLILRIAVKIKAFNNIIQYSYEIRFRMPNSCIKMNIHRMNCNHRNNHFHPGHGQLLINNQQEILLLVRLFHGSAVFYFLFSFLTRVRPNVLRLSLHKKEDNFRRQASCKKSLETLYLFVQEEVIFL